MIRIDSNNFLRHPDRFPFEDFDRIEIDLQPHNEDYYYGQHDTKDWINTANIGEQPQQSQRHLTVPPSHTPDTLSIPPSPATTKSTDFDFDFDLEDYNEVEPNHPKGESIFPELPPLYTGHPEEHLRYGIMNARRHSATGKPDAEKAFFVADLREIYRQHMRWVEALPEIQPFYAVKCNPDPYIIRLLASLGAGFDCASNGEISQVLNTIGQGTIEPSRIIFANPCKATSFVRSAARMGVDMMTFDNSDELYKIAKAHPKAKLVLRILTDDSKSLCAFGIKFGASLDNASGLLHKAKELGLEVVGVSFHVGSGCWEPEVYRDAIRRAKWVFDVAEKEVGYEFDLLDVGGGFEDGLFERAAEVLKSAISEFFGEEWTRTRSKELKIIAEPGRFYVSKAFRLAVNVIARRAPLPGKVIKKEEADGQPEVMYYVNDGVYGAFNCILFDHQNPVPRVVTLNGSFNTQPTSSETEETNENNDNGQEQLQLASVWGPTCDSIDCVSKSVMLPKGIQVGDWLGFDNMGAYTVCAASQFNGFEVSRVIYTVGGELDEESEVVVDGEGEAIRKLLWEFKEKIGGDSEMVF